MSFGRRQLLEKQEAFACLRQEALHSEQELKLLQAQVDREEAGMAAPHAFLSPLREPHAHGASSYPPRSDSGLRPWDPFHLSVSPETGEVEDLKAQLRNVQQQMLDMCTVLRETLGAKAGQSSGVEARSAAFRASQYGRDALDRPAPYSVTRLSRGPTQSAVINARIWMPPPEKWVGKFNNHAELEVFIDASKGYYEAAGKISVDQALDNVAAKHFVKTLFATTEVERVSAYTWATMQLETVKLGDPYSLMDLYKDMRLFWTDPTYTERMMEQFMAVKQNHRPANSRRGYPDRASSRDHGSLRRACCFQYS